MNQIRVRSRCFAGTAFVATLVVLATWDRAITAPAQVAAPTPPPGTANPAQPAPPPAGPAQGPGMEAHQDMLRSAPPETAINDWDPRLKPEIRYGAIGEDAIIQGDIVIGKVAEVRQRTLYNLADQANQLGDIAQLKLTDKQKEVLAALKNVKVPEDAAETAASRRESRARRLLNDLAKLEPISEELRGYPTTLVDEMKEQAKQSGGLAAKSAIQLGDQYRWRGGNIPYMIDSNAPNRPIIAAAIDQWNTQTDKINLRPRQNGDRDYVRFVAGAGCSSPIGRMGGEQRITLAPGCAKPQIMHEIGHSVGLWHEQCRNDRDNYLTIRDENVSPDMLYNFDKAGTQAAEVGTFDFASMMLYGCSAFSDNGAATMVPRWPQIPQCRYGVESGFIKELSTGDLAGVDSMYPSPANPANNKHRQPSASDLSPSLQPVPGVRMNAPVVPPPLSPPKD